MARVRFGKPMKPLCVIGIGFAVFYVITFITIFSLRETLTYEAPNLYQIPGHGDAEELEIHTNSRSAPSEHTNQANQQRAQFDHVTSAKKSRSSQLAASTFFDIDRNDIEGLIQYWREPGVPHPDKYSTYFTELLDYDLKDIIMQQDEHTNPELQSVYDLKHTTKQHALNADYDLYAESSSHPPPWDIYRIFAANEYRHKVVISKEEMYDKHEEYLRENHQNVELIFPENDTLLFAMIDKFSEHVRNITYQRMDHEAAELFMALRKFTKEEAKDTAPSANKRRLQSQQTVLSYTNTLNGQPADMTYFRQNASSAAYYHKDQDGHLVYHKNNRFWISEDEKCVQRKGLSVYPNWRILYASAPLTCDIILNELLDPIVDCVKKHGSKCDLFIGNGYYRLVFKSEAPAKYLVENPSDPEKMMPIVLKVTKRQFLYRRLKWMKQVRETIFLQQLQRWEKQFIAEFGKQFTSLGQDRAFYYVPEYGHCISPTYITVSPFYETNLEDFINAGNVASMTLQQVTVKALEVLAGLQVMHNIEGGPFLHNDLQPRQFMVDDNQNILINDFNYGTFQEYYFENAVETKNQNARTSSDIVVPCTYCDVVSRGLEPMDGHYRAPEELARFPLNEKADIWSICLVIWQLFSRQQPWSTLQDWDAIKAELRTQQMRPSLPDSMPPYIKDVMTRCWKTDIYQRPDVNELMRNFMYFYHNVDRLSDGKQNWTLHELERNQIYKGRNPPNRRQKKKRTSLE